MVSPVVSGVAAPRFEPVRDVVQSGLDSGAETGMSLCVIQAGEIVLDLWGGVADADTGRPWQTDTIVNTFSLTKTMVVLAVLLLTDRGELDLEAPVKRYWPQFAAAGKEDVLVRHLLGHTSGLSGWEIPVSLDDVYDVERTAALLAAQRPWWKPGDGSGYHAMTYGHLIGEVVRRITGGTLGAFLAAEFAAPLDADYYLGTPAEADDRIATLVPPPASVTDWSRIPPDSVPRKTLLNPVLDVRRVGDRQWRAAELGAMNGHGNARSVAMLQALVSHGGSFASGPYLRRETVNRLFETQSDSVDRVLGMPLTFGLGYALGGPLTTPRRVCWWSGYGGSLVVNDLDRRLTIGYVMNKMSAGLLSLERAARYVDAIYAAVD